MALIHFAENARRVGHEEPATMYEVESVGFDKPTDRAIQIASAGDHALQRVQSILPCSDAGLVATPMFQEDQ